MVFRLALAGSPLSPHLPSAAHPKGKAGARTRGEVRWITDEPNVGPGTQLLSFLPPCSRTGPLAATRLFASARPSTRVAYALRKWSSGAPPPAAAHAKPCLLAAQSMDLYNFPGPPHAHAAQCTYTRKWKSNFSTENGRKRKGRSHDVSENKLFRSQFPTCH